MLGMYGGQGALFVRPEVARRHEVRSATFADTDRMCRASQSQVNCSVCLVLSFKLYFKESVIMKIKCIF